LEADGQQAGAAAVGEEAEVADAYEAAREQMQQKTPQELVDGQLHQLLLVAVSGVAPAEDDATVFEGEESVVGDGNAMGVGAEITQGVFGASERVAWRRRPSLVGTRFAAMMQRRAVRPGTADFRGTEACRCERRP
jgi:hypothetical protein